MGHYQKPQPAPKPAFSVKKLPLGYVVVDAQGKYVSRAFQLEASAQGALTRAIRDAGLRERPCLCCKRPFMSEGIHNRMCPACRNGRAEPQQEVRPYITRGL